MQTQPRALQRPARSNTKALPDAQAPSEQRAHGKLLLVPIAIFPIPIFSEGLTLTGDIPCECGFAGMTFYLQVLELDPGASHGVSFTHGLCLNLGY